MRTVELNKENFNSLPEYRLEDITKNGLQVGEKYLNHTGHYEILSFDTGVLKVAKIRYLSTGKEETVDLETLTKDTVERYTEEIEKDGQREIKKTTQTDYLVTKNKGYINLHSGNVWKTLLYLAENCRIEASVRPDMEKSFRAWITKRTGEILEEENPRGLTLDIAEKRWRQFKLVITVKKPNFDLDFGTYKVKYVGDGNVVIHSKSLAETLFDLGFKFWKNHNVDAIKNEAMAYLELGKKKGLVD